jgi:hypothetical protein
VFVDVGTFNHEEKAGIVIEQFNCLFGHLRERRGIAVIGNFSISRYR